MCNRMAAGWQGRDSARVGWDCTRGSAGRVRSPAGPLAGSRSRPAPIDAACGPLLPQSALSSLFLPAHVVHPSLHPHPPTSLDTRLTLAHPPATTPSTVHRKPSLFTARISIFKQYTNEYYYGAVAARHGSDPDNNNKQ